MNKGIESGATRRRVAGGALVVVAAANAWLGYVFGGYYIGEWALFALFAVLLLLVVVGLGLLGGGRSRLGVLATALFLGYTAWTFLSILWSANRGDALYGSSLTLLYLIVFWVSVTLLAAGARRRLVLAALALGPGVVAVLLAPMLLSGATESEGFFLDGRLQGTAGYFNAQAAFLVMSFFAGIYVSGSCRLHPAVRALSLAGITAGLQVAVLTQSRGAAVAFALSLAVFFLFSGQRLRGLVALLPVFFLTLLAFPTLNEVYLQLRGGETVTGEGLAAIDRAKNAVLLSAVASGVYGLLWSILDRFWRPSESLVRLAGIACLAAVALVFVVGSVVFVNRVGSPLDFAGERWTAFRTNDTSGQEESRYLSASGSGRFTLWEVAWQDFQSNPVLGVGTHNYEATYYRLREVPAGWVKQPHSLPLEVVSERGLVGGALFFGFLAVCVGAGLYRRFGELNAEGKGQVGAILACLAYWFVHSSAEWFWQIPAVTVPATIYLAMLVVPWGAPHSGEEVFSPLGRPVRLAGLGIAVLALAAIGPLFVSNLYAQRAAAGSQENPWTSLRDLERAQLFDPANSSLARREGDLAYSIGDLPRASQAYARAVELNPEYYANYAVLGGFYERLGQPERALELYRQSRELNPLDPDLRLAEERALQQVEER
ncbi:O-Antigen ligase [Rubrobacter radiotolerans]|uniref:O-Antigen ligase n=1 Tax=Rubrobacter radiotolerans TaxID=42256 RepID=A0A023X3S7_RUBRA|nr:O-antigen ligase family protein [Rubrobacter radiotolerans]AHY47013.1 O-Antigen ligase [Rubrobacter radiotolerans]MDX5894419.1 O-antigen ligase family protein [Rubrobacter radiotolerans]SMC05964.1 TPR repeat-containing protein [Rubrobacter radiotolerans DSM 5868]